MLTVLINGQAFALPPRFVPGDLATVNVELMFNDIQFSRIKTKLHYMLKHGQLAAHEIQAKAEELWAKPLDLRVTLDDEDDYRNNPILTEAIAIATDLIVTRMAREGLPPPKGIEDHAKALVDANPMVLEKARLRVEARQKAMDAALAKAS